MGAQTFYTTAPGKNATEAFNAACQQARYDHGHSGYTGTIAEKRAFVMITVPEGQDPERFAHGLVDDGDPRIDDKWGPAGCIDLGGGRYAFFGWASS